MGFWYFLILFCGIFLIAFTLLKQSFSTGQKFTNGLIGAAMIAFSLFMFQDGSAEIVASLLNML